MADRPHRSCVVIAGGGTGGHIYPGIAIARAIRVRHPDMDVHFVGTPAGLEKKIVPAAGFPLHLMTVGKLNESGLRGKIRTLLGLPRALMDSVNLLMELKPSAVLGVGGYASGPFVLMAAILGFRTAIWEPNAKPGLTNRWLSRFVRDSFVVFSEAKKELKSRRVTPVGLPVREEVERVGSSPSGDTSGSRPFRVLVFGGSQGARTLNAIVRAAVGRDEDWRRDIEIVHQTGAMDFTDVQKDYAARKGVEALEYLHDMDTRYRWADLVICRAGASTVAELAAARKPAILVPLPWAADDHQRKNAESLAGAGGAIAIPQSELTPDRLIDEIRRLKADEKAMAAMRDQLARFHQPRSAEVIAEALLRLT